MDKCPLISVSEDLFIYSDWIPSPSVRAPAAKLSVNVRVPHSWLRAAGPGSGSDKGPRSVVHNTQSVTDLSSLWRPDNKSGRLSISSWYKVTKFSLCQAWKNILLFDFRLWVELEICTWNMNIKTKYNIFQFTDWKQKYLLKIQACV